MRFSNLFKTNAYLGDICDASYDTFFRVRAAAHRLGLRHDPWLTQPQELTPRMETLPRAQAIDLSHTVEHGLVTYRGLPAPIICDYLSREASRAVYAPGTEFHIGKIEMVANTGTYVDSPFHRYADGRDLAALDPRGLPMSKRSSFVAARSRERRPASAPSRLPPSPTGVDLRDKVVLFDTGWDRHFGSEAYFSGLPFLTADAARYLVACSPGHRRHRLAQHRRHQRRHAPCAYLPFGADIPSSNT